MPATGGWSVACGQKRGKGDEEAEGVRGDIGNGSEEENTGTGSGHVFRKVGAAWPAGSSTCSRKAGWG